MMVQLTRIYTRGGDRGETSLGDGTRVPKTDLRIEAAGVHHSPSARVARDHLPIWARLSF